MLISFGRDARRRLLLTLGAVCGGLFLMLLATPRVGPGVASPVPGPLRTVPVSSKELALTFDISWGTVMPPKVLAILEKEKVPATFFLSGPWSKNHPEMVQAIIKGGFQVESHGQKHVNYSGLSNAGIQQNIQSAADILATYGVKTDMVRPPNGDYNKRALKVAADMGQRIVLWGTDSRDWMNPGVGAITQRVLKGAHSGDIILLHASDTCKQTDLALPAILSGLREKGFKLVTVDQLLQDQVKPPLAALSRGPGSA